MAATYRERRLAKAERLRGWAEQRESRAAAALEREWAELLLDENDRLRQEIQTLRAQQEAQAAFTMMEEEGEVPR